MDTHSTRMAGRLGLYISLRRIRWLTVRQVNVGDLDGETQVCPTMLEAETRFGPKGCRLGSGIGDERHEGRNLRSVTIFGGAARAVCTLPKVASRFISLFGWRGKVPALDAEAPK